VLRNYLEEHAADVLAISIRNLRDNAYSALAKHLDYCRQLVAIARRHSNAIVVIGGAQVSA
jgi:hypothetical protein